jgi:hypothetical protein
MERLIQWLVADGNAIAILVTLGMALLLICCLECSHCCCRDKDEIFRYHAH